jgi:hypothetical protein
VRIPAIEKGSVVEITRDREQHCWAVIIGSHKLSLPVCDTADAVFVVMLLKSKVEGITVRVQL